MGGLFTRRLPSIAAQSLLIVLVSKWPAGAKLYRALIACALLVSTGFLHPRSAGFGGSGRIRNATVFRTRTGAALFAAIALAGAGPAKAEIVTEDFQAYSDQIDTTGILVEEPGHPTVTIFRITTTGNTDPSDPIVAIVSEVLAASAGIGAEGANRFWTLGSSAGATGIISGQAGHVMIGDIGLGGDAPDNFTAGGPLATFFSTPRNLTGGEISARVRETTAAADTQFRFLLSDAAEREIWTAPFSLTKEFQTFTVPVTAFTIPLDPDEGSFDFKRVEIVGFEIFTTPGIAPVLSFNVDDVRIDAPEPAKAMPWLSLLLD